MSESQKEEIERSKIGLQQKETEILELKRQMVKLSEIIDKQGSELQNVSGDVGSVVVFFFHQVWV